MLTGRVIRFDESRGFGSIGPEGGGQEDVFLHVNGLADGTMSVPVGTRVEFKAMEGQRGLKAFDVRVAEAADQGPDAHRGSARPGA